MLTTRTFCGTCGTPLTFESSRHPEETDITICSLADPERVPPRDHTRAATKLSWVKLADGLPVYPEQRAKAWNPTAAPAPRSAEVRFILPFRMLMTP